MSFRQLYILILFIAGFHYAYASGKGVFSVVAEVLKPAILKKADWAMEQEPKTITDYPPSRSAGGLDDFYSEGDYWWPDPANPDSPYIQRDGLSNPENFTAHREAMISFSQIVGTLTSAFIITHENRYAEQAVRHLRAWFIHEKTAMNPSLLYAQAIKGRVTGRSIGIIDMIQMMEVAQSVRVLESKKAIREQDLMAVKKWFSQYLDWVTTHPYGVKERDAKNNHGTCWVMQVAVFARLTGNKILLEDCASRYKNFLLPDQMDITGAFPLELSRTKPYGYSLFNLDAMATICQVLSVKGNNLWNYKLSDGRTIRKALEFMMPFVENKERWPYPPDVMYWNEWPVAQPFLIFGYQHYKVRKWMNTWKKLEHFPETEEVIRNVPIRNPLIWL